MKNGRFYVTHTMLREMQKESGGAIFKIPLEFTPFKPHADMHNVFKVYSNVPSLFFAHTYSHWSCQTIAQIHNKTGRLLLSNACGKGLNAFYKDEISAAGRGGKRVLHITSLVHCQPRKKQESALLQCTGIAIIAARKCQNKSNWSIKSKRSNEDLHTIFLNTLLRTELFAKLKHN